MAFLAELCGVPFPSGVVPELDSAQRMPQQLSRLIELAWLSFLRAEARARPVLLVLDDLQWSDAHSVTRVGAALRDLAASPVMAPTVDHLAEFTGRALTGLPLL